MNEIWNTIKSKAAAIFAVIAGVLFFMLKRKNDEVAKVATDLAKANFKITTQENDKDYEDAKTRADRLVTEYQSGKRTDTTPR